MNRSITLIHFRHHTTWTSHVMLWFSPIICRRDTGLYYSVPSLWYIYLTVWLSFIYFLPTPNLLMPSFPCHLNLILIECRQFFSEFSIRGLLSLLTECLILICSRYSLWWDSKPESAISLSKSLFSWIRKHRPTPFTWKLAEIRKRGFTEIFSRTVNREENWTGTIKRRTFHILERYIWKNIAFSLHLALFNDADICLGYVVLNGDYELLMRRIREKVSEIYVRVVP